MIEFIFNVFKTIILGIVQGITEWLPISSTAHLILFSNFFPIEPTEFFNVFKVVIQFGSILAIVVLYFHKLNPWDAKKGEVKKKQTLRLWLNVIIGAIPAGIFGLALNDIIDDVLSKEFVIAITLILYGIIFIIVEKHPKVPTIYQVDDLDWKTSLKIGFFQCLALIPGTSRSGATILGGLSCGCTRKVASEFSFFVAIPVMVGASGLKVLKYIINVGLFSFSQLLILIIGTFVAFLVSLVAVKRLLKYVRNHNFTAFGYYRIVLGIIVLVFFYIL